VSDPVVTIQDVSKTYNQGRVQALHNVTLDIAPASFIALAGPSGSGKTTLLNMIGALDIPDSGEVTVAGQRLNELSDHQRTSLRRERIGFVFQQFNLIPVLTAAENVALPLEILPSISASERKKRAMDMLKRVGLEGMEHRKPTQLSGGQQQRIAVARALVKDPPLVLADEPTANLDGSTGMAIVDLMNKMRDELGVSFVFASHDPRLLERVDTVIEMVDGCVTP
jgi:putative ABC transport system ATP-binding protein